jgi:predicted Zn-dependent peptidase
MKDIQPLCFTLSNGVRLVYLYKSTEVSHVGFTFLAGSKFEQSQQVGLAHFLEHCVFKGTSKRKGLQVLSRLDDVGGELNAFTAKEEICLYASITQQYVSRAIDLLADISLNSTFPAEELEKEKLVIFDELNSYLDSPSDKIFDDFEAHLFPNHPLGNNILGTKKSVKGFKREDLISFVDTHFTSDNLVVSYVGNYSKIKLVALLESALISLPNRAERPIYDLIGPYEPFSIRTKEANYQSHAVIGGMGPSYLHEDRRGMGLLINVLGGPALNSRLTLAIREKHGLAYAVDASYTSFSDTGFWCVYLGTDPKNIDKAILLAKKEIERLCDKGLSSAQLARAKKQFKGHMSLGMDSNMGLMLGLGKSLLAFNQIDTIKEIHEGIDRLTTQELMEIANKYLAPSLISELIFDCKKGGNKG